jgi:hypothetical protein
MSGPVFLFNEPPKGSKSLEIYKISLTFCFDKLYNLSKSVHTGENSQILSVEQKNNYYVQWPAIKTSHHFSVTSKSKCVINALMTLTFK